jgi:hypothetical protein
VDLYFSNCKRGGYGITPEGELISVFSLPGARLGGSIVVDAITRGAKYLYCYDFNDILVTFYRSHGFVVTERYAFDPALAPSGWEYQILGSPDYVKMEICDA